MVIDPQTLAELRQLIAGTMPEQVAVYRRTRTSDGMGGWTESETLVATTPARLSRVDARLVELARALQVTAQAVLTVPWSLDLRPGDVVVRGSQRWRVEAVLPDPSQHVVRRAFVAEEKP